MTEPAAAHPVVRQVAYGRPATEALAEAIATAKRSHPLDPVTVVVSSNLAGLSARRLVGGGTVGRGARPGLANVSFLTPLRLAELLVADALPGHPLTNAALAAAARVVLRRRPEPFGRVADHHASEAAVVGLYAELSRLRPATLAQLEGRDDRTATLVAVHRAVEQALRGQFSDEDARAHTAAERVATDPAAAAALGHLVWFLPERLTPAQAALIAAAVRAVPTQVVVGCTGDEDADAAVRRACRDAGVDLARDPGSSGAAVRAEPPTGTRIISVSDPDEEVRAACREVLALAEAGTPLDRIGVLYPTPDPYARALHEQFDAAGIPHNGPARTRLADGVVGRTLLGALALPERDWGRADVLAVASAGPLRHDGAVVPASAWETLSRAAGVLGGLDDWSTKLDALAGQREERHRLLAEDPATSPGYLAGLLDDAHRARDLARWVHDLSEQVGAVDRADGWADKVDRARALLEHLLGRAGSRRGWPEHELAAAERVEAALARLTLLDGLDPHPATVTFRRAVEAELDEPTGRSGRFGHGVLHGPLAMAPGLDLDAVLVLGMAEGTCPSTRAEDALLPDDVRAATGDELLTRDERLRRQHRHLLAALDAGRAHRILVFPRGDLRGSRTRLPSRWLLATATALRGERVHSTDFASLGAPVVDEVRSFADGLTATPAAVSLVERDLATLEARRRAGLEPADAPFAGADLRRGLVAQAARRSEHLTEWDGNLAGLPVPSPSAGKRLSASAMQAWASCPFRYFLGQVLGLAERPEPETVTTISALDRGTLLHEILDRFVREAIERPDGPPSPDEPWPTADRARLRQIAAEAFARFRGEGRTGRDLLWRLEQRFLLGDLDHFLDDDDARRAALRSTPLAVEQPFGIDGVEPLRIELDDGRVLAFRGYIDRVDTTADGGHVVIDYKSGKGDAYRGLADDPVLAGTALQLGLYAEAVSRQRGGEASSYFWMLGERGGYALHGGPWDDERRARFRDVLAAITDGIEAGTFAARPGEYVSFWRTHDNCGFCDFDRLCPRDRDEHELAKAAAPELAVLRRLALPVAADDESAPDR
ncbi:MAG: PD-(D/E)XK nuclease family protein [Microthrixaceae bacterium]|nr:PD-(D/E)XK nuclease family protein [Microthrixaceae bacterium]